MVTNVLETQGTKASAAMVLNKSSCNIISSFSTSCITGAQWVNLIKTCGKTRHDNAKNLFVNENIRILKFWSIFFYIHIFFFNSFTFWRSDVIWGHRSWSTLAQVMACCLTAPNHYLNQCDLSSMRSCGIHQREISQSKIFNLDMSLKISNLKSLSYLSGANELIQAWYQWQAIIYIGEGPVYWSIFMSLETGDLINHMKALCHENREWKQFAMWGIWGCAKDFITPFILKDSVIYIWHVYIICMCTS